MLKSRLTNAALIVSAAVLVPAAAFAQDVSTASMMDNSSGFIGGLVVWLLPIGGAIAVGVMLASDKMAQQGRTGTIRR